MPEQTPPINNIFSDFESSHWQLRKQYRKFLKYFLYSPLLLLLGPAFLIYGILWVFAGLRVLIQAIKIKRSERTEAIQVDGLGYVTPSLIMPGIILLFGWGLIFIIALPHDIFQYTYRKHEFNMFENELKIYAEEHDGHWPDPNRWCDILSEQSHQHSIIRAKKGEIKLALNRHAVELGLSMPNDMVLLFESKLGWNQTGGIELLTDNEKRDYILVLYGDGHSEVIRKQHAYFLRWKVSDTHSLPEIDTKTPKQTIIIISGILAILLFVLHVRYLSHYWHWTLILGLFGTATGWLLGEAGEFLYVNPLHIPRGIGQYYGLFSGLVAGVLFIMILGHFDQKLHRVCDLTGYATVLGAVTGILTGGFVHLLLMIHFQEYSWIALYTGTSCGLWAGTLLGWITGNLIRKF